MSGICGLLRLDGGPAEGVGAMLAAMAHRGPDGLRPWTDGSVALGHASLVTTPEAAGETQPLRDPATGCVLVADARLDNRDELLAALGLGPEARIWGDGALILRAWLRWGDAATDRLLGDWTFALWDPRARRLLLARDHTGTRALSYAHLPGRLLAFGTDVESVLAAPGVPRRLDHRRVVDLLEGTLEVSDPVTTFWRDVHRLPAAHALAADARGVAVRRHWRLEPGPRLRLRDDAAYAEAFREVFDRAVAARLRAPGRPGVMLSGGIDSGAVAAVAARRLAAEGRGPLPAFSVTGPDPGSRRETQAIALAQTLPGLEPHAADHAALGDLAPALVQRLLHLDEPFDGSMTVPAAAYLLARRAGVRVVLDGAGGDIAFSNGDHVLRLLRGGALREAWREATAYASHNDDRRPSWRILLDEARQAATPGWARALRRRFDPRRRLGGQSGLVAAALAREGDLAGRWATMDARRPRNGQPQAERLAAILGHPLAIAGRERYDRVAARCGVEARDPYRDRRLLEFVVRLPAWQLTAQGWPKWILRTATEGLLPDALRWRGGREHVGWATTRAVLASWDGWNGVLASQRAALEPLVTSEAWREESDTPTVASQPGILYLALWSASRPGEGSVFSPERELKERRQ